MAFRIDDEDPKDKISLVFSMMKIRKDAFIYIYDF